MLNYIHSLKLELNPYSFLLRGYTPPSFWDFLGKDTERMVKYNNHISDFFDWILNKKLSLEDDFGRAVVPVEYWNPVRRRSKSGGSNAETFRTPLPYRFIRELRMILCQGSDFKNWAWAHQACDVRENGSGPSGDWFKVIPSMIDENDPDCVWRKREVKIYDKKRKHSTGKKEIYEIWSPVRAVALFVKLMLPLRTHQVRMLDSGEADTWRYNNGQWSVNDNHLATGNDKRPHMRGVFHRSVDAKSGKIMTGFYINTNKTSDINKNEKDKGYVIPWQYTEALYWLEKLRNWQSKYNPLKQPTQWTKLKTKHDNSLPHEDILRARGTACFLFRHTSASYIEDRILPLAHNDLDTIWYRLLTELEKRCEERGETLDDGSKIEFVAQDKKMKNYTTLYPLHNLRVSLITAYALEGEVPFHILSKLVAGHSRLIMTLYYTKAGKAHVTEVMNSAEKAMLEKDNESYRRFLGNASYQQIEERFAFNDPAALFAATQQKSVAGFVFDDKGICLLGSSRCDIGGEAIATRGNAGTVYAPVPGYPLEKNCIRCRFFLTGPGFLAGLLAHANDVSYRSTECSNRLMPLEQKVIEIEDLRHECEEKGQPFTKIADLEQICRLYEQEAEKADKLANDLQSTVRLISRCEQILKTSYSKGIQLISAGTISDIRFAMEETQSEMYQLEVMCENAILYPEVDASKATIRRSQILDAMLELNNRSPIFFKLTPEQQLHVGNHAMQLMKHRAGSMKNAVTMAEGMVKLSEIGLLNEVVDLIETETKLPVLLASIITGNLPVGDDKSNDNGISLERIFHDARNKGEN